MWPDDHVFSIGELAPETASFAQEVLACAKEII